MNVFDGIILVILLIFVIRGLVRGFLVETLGLLGLVLAVLLSVRYLDAAVSLLSGFISLSRSIVAVIAFVLIFVTVVVAVRIGISLLRNVLRAASLTWLDRTGGAAVGLLKGAILAGAFALVVSILPFSQTLQQQRAGSFLLPPFRKVLPLTFDVVRKLWPGTKHFVKELGESFEGEVLESQVEDVLRNYGGANLPGGSDKTNE